LNGRRMRRLMGLVRKARYCPLCGWRGFRFEPYGNQALRRRDAHCPACGSLERHRVARLLLRDRIVGRQAVLHMAPEPQMIAWLVSLSREYLNADLSGHAMARLDLTDTGLPDASKTLIWCSHVLEHIPDDGKALREMRRVLAPGGLAVLQVPIGGDHTLEDSSIASDAARLSAYFQEDHVRLYGRDIVERIEAAGFACETMSAASLDPAEQTLCAVTHPVFREVFLCRRPVDA